MTPDPYIDWRKDLTAEDLSQLIFGGALIRFRDLSNISSLKYRAWSLVTATFGSDIPESAEHHLDPTEFRRLSMAARKHVKDDREIQNLWRDLLTKLGYAPDETHRDLIRLRVVPSRSAHASRFAQPLPAHRDSWGSGIAAQINWWLPLRPLAPNATMRLWPQLFSTPIANSSGDWDYQRVKSGDTSAPLLPKATEPLTSPGMDVLIETGEMLAFSAAQLHAGCVGGSAITRFSMDTRTVWQRDRRAGRGAPMVDLADVPERWDMFQRETSGETV